MHKTDGADNVSNLFDGGNPAVPRLPTQVDPAWLNAVQEELINILTVGGVTPVKGTWTQVLTALRAIFVDRSNAQAVSGAKTFNANTIVNGVLTVNGPGSPSGAGMFNGSQFGAYGITDDSSWALGGAGMMGKGFGLTPGVGGFADNSTANGIGVYAQGGNSGGRGLVAKSNNTVNAPIKIIPQSAAPSTGVEGDLYMNSTDHKLYVHNGTTWVVVGTQT